MHKGYMCGDMLTFKIGGHFVWYCSRRLQNLTWDFIQFSDTRLREPAQVFLKGVNLVNCTTNFGGLPESDFYWFIISESDTVVLKTVQSKSRKYTHFVPFPKQLYPTHSRFGPVYGTVVL